MGADYSSTFAGLSISLAVAAILGAGTILAAPGFVRWLVDRVSSFFQDEPDDDDDEDSEDDGLNPDHVYTPCEGVCGREFLRCMLDDDCLCAECTDYSED